MQMSLSLEQHKLYEQLLACEDNASDSNADTRRWGLTPESD